MKHNTPRQNKNCLQNFDLSDHRQVLSDLAIQIHHQFINVMEDALFPMIGMLLVVSSFFFFFSFCLKVNTCGGAVLSFSAT